MPKQPELIEQFEIFDIPSPCIGVCQSNNRGYCLGCFRSRDERFHWNALTLAQKKMVTRLCQQRKKRVLAKAKNNHPDDQHDSEQQTHLDF